MLNKIIAFIKMEYRISKAYPMIFIFQFFPPSLIFSILLWFFVARLIGQNEITYLKDYGSDYFSFVVIGLAMSQFLWAGLNALPAYIRRGQTTGSLEAVLATATHPAFIILSSSLWAYIVAMVRFIFCVFLGLLLGLKYSINFQEILLLLPILLLNGLAVLSFGVISSAWILVFKRGDLSRFLVRAFFGFQCGVYFPITILPLWLQGLSKGIPLTYSLRIVRKTIMTDLPIASLRQDLFVIAGFALFLFPISLWILNYSIMRAKRAGSLAHF
ncbi:MAG: ABC transporter permease [Candidatus Omnitrophica bacterium]|nr:ABC transporter permease [Candidatus Omnitrophota bacterium]